MRTSGFGAGGSEGGTSAPCRPLELSDRRQAPEPDSRPPRHTRGSRCRSAATASHKWADKHLRSLILATIDHCSNAPYSRSAEGTHFGRRQERCDAIAASSGGAQRTLPAKGISGSARTLTPPPETSCIRLRGEALSLFSVHSVA